MKKSAIFDGCHFFRAAPGRLAIFKAWRRDREGEMWRISPRWGPARGSRFSSEMMVILPTKLVLYRGSWEFQWEQWWFTPSTKSSMWKMNHRRRFSLGKISWVSHIYVGLLSDAIKHGDLCLFDLYSICQWLRVYCLCPSGVIKRGYLGNPIHKWQFNGTIIFKWYFSIAMFDYRKVTMEF